jgi:hypothetical protein
MSLRARVKRLEARLPPVKPSEDDEFINELLTDEHYDLLARQILAGQVPTDGELSGWAKERFRDLEWRAARGELTL